MLIKRKNMQKITPPPEKKGLLLQKVIEKQCFVR